MKKIFGFYMLLAAAGLFITSCDKDITFQEKDSLVSVHDLTISHHMGENCMECHHYNGIRGWFAVAGTVYDTSRSNISPNGYIYLYTAPDSTGSMKGAIQVDGNGNFYTTNAVFFPAGGLYPEVVGQSGARRMMYTSVTDGQCNKCHGDTENPIWVE